MLQKVLWARCRGVSPISQGLHKFDGADLTGCYTGFATGCMLRKTAPSYTRLSIFHSRGLSRDLDDHEQCFPRRSYCQQ